MSSRSADSGFDEKSDGERRCRAGDALGFAGLTIFVRGLACVDFTGEVGSETFLSPRMAWSDVGGVSTWNDVLDALCEFLLESGDVEKAGAGRRDG